MKVSQIAKICNELANLGLPADCYQEENQDYSTDNCAKLLLTVANLVLDELYSNWATAIDKAIVTSEGGLIDTQQISLNKVVSLTDSQGQTVPFRYTERGLFVDYDGTFNLTYTKLPTHVGWNEEFVSPSPRITPRIFAYGMLGEYFHSLGDVEPAERYLAKYYDALRAVTRKISTVKMPARRWW